MSCATNPVTGKKELMLVSTEQEKEIGHITACHSAQLSSNQRDLWLRNMPCADMMLFILLLR
jgi:hypothetical protein